MLAALALAGEGRACVCAQLPVERRLDDADAALVGKIVAERQTSVRGARQTIVTVEVVQRVKGDVPDTVVVRSPLGTDCDLDDAVAPAIGRDGMTGLLLTRSPDGGWLGSVCSVVEAGELVAAGGEPRGGPIKVAIGVVILVLVLLLAFIRLRRGSRPHLPGAPEP